MKIDNSHLDSGGKLKNGVVTETFKDGTVSCVGAYVDGEKTGEWKYAVPQNSLFALVILSGSAPKLA